MSASEKRQPTAVATDQGERRRGSTERSSRSRHAAKEVAWKRNREKVHQRAHRSEEQKFDQPMIFDRPTGWGAPVSQYRLSARFGETGPWWSSTHQGLDFVAPAGTPVDAVGDGEIVFAGYNGPYGYQVRLRDDDGTETWYNHLSSITVSAGSVRAGQPIGRVGSTGNVTGAHLDLEVRTESDAILDPADWLRERGVEVEPDA